MVKIHLKSSALSSLENCSEIYFFLIKQIPSKFSTKSKILYLPLLVGYITFIRVFDWHVIEPLILIGKFDICGIWTQDGKHQKTCYWVCWPTRYRFFQLVEIYTFLLMLAWGKWTRYNVENSASLVLTLSILKEYKTRPT